MTQETFEETDLMQSKNAPIFSDFYKIGSQFSYVGIEIDEDTGKIGYKAIEPTLSDEEIQILERLKYVLIEKMDIPLDVLGDEGQLDDYLKEQVKIILKKFKKKIPKEAEDKFFYYLKRDFLGYGKIDLLMQDQNIEDISCNGINTPIYVWHRVYESIPTNIRYDSKEELASIVKRLAYKAGHQISVANPILEGTLPEGYRVHLTLEEVSKRGKTFTIRKFRATPYTIIDLIKFGTISPKIAAYLWVLVENLRSVMICGTTASGKTSLLNSTSMFIKPEMKVVTIEEVRELRLHENWIPMVTRPSFQPGVQEITLFDLLKSALRQRPDYIIVGEVRGEEAYTLFQSIAVGHGGLCTIHAESVDSVIKRLLTRPMNIPEIMIPLMNVLIQIKRMKIGEKIVRRAVKVVEITRGKDETKEVEIKERFFWDPESDSFEYVDPKGDNVFSLISQMNHVPIEKLKLEIKKREKILEWMTKKNISSYENVADIVRNYYLDSEEVYNRARLG